MKKKGATVSRPRDRPNESAYRVFDFVPFVFAAAAAIESAAIFSAAIRIESAMRAESAAIAAAMLSCLAFSFAALLHAATATSAATRATRFMQILLWKWEPSRTWLSLLAFRGPRIE